MSTLALAGSLAGAAAVIAWRVRETRRPLTTRSIVLPPVAMSAGLAMFLFPPFRLPVSWAAAAVAAGATLLALPLIHTTVLTREGEAIMMQRSRAFIAILLALCAVRLALRAELAELLPATRTAALLYLLALGMILRWRWSTLTRYRALRRSR